MALNEHTVCLTVSTARELNQFVIGAGGEFGPRSGIHDLGLYREGEGL